MQGRGLVESSTHRGRQGCAGKRQGRGFCRSWCAAAGVPLQACPFSCTSLHHQRLAAHMTQRYTLTCLSVRARHLRTTSPSSARFSSVLSSSVKYLASRVWPCLLTSRRNLMVMLLLAPAAGGPRRLSCALATCCCCRELGQRLCASRKKPTVAFLLELCYYDTFKRVEGVVGLQAAWRIDERRGAASDPPAL